MKKSISAILIFLALSCRNNTGEGETIPSFDFLLSDSITRVNTATIPEGTPIALLYFSPDCEHCQHETETIIHHMDSLKQVRSGNPLVKLIKEQVRILEDRGSIVSFFWCKAHCGIIGNERADEEAKLAFSVPITYNKRPPSMFAHLRKIAIKTQWSQMPVNIHDGLILRLWPTTIDRIKDHYIPQYKYFHQFLSGHGPFRDHIFRFQQEPTCLCGFGIHSANHVLNICQLSNGPRVVIGRLLPGHNHLPCSEIVIRLFKRSQTKFNRVNQLLQRMQILSPLSLESSVEWPP